VVTDEPGAIQSFQYAAYFAARQTAQRSLGRTGSPDVTGARLHTDHQRDAMKGQRPANDRIDLPKP
jgi:hypothetical protein